MVYLPSNIKIVLQTLKDISNIKIIPNELIKSAMKHVSITSDAIGEIGDIILALIALVLIVLVLLALLYFAKNSPK